MTYQTTWPIILSQMVFYFTLTRFITQIKNKRNVTELEFVIELIILIVIILIFGLAVFIPVTIAEIISLFVAIYLGIISAKIRFSWFVEK